jgi:hypothetical protein
VDDTRSPGALTEDAALAREIEAALKVDPSPEFVARVRTRIAAEPAPSVWSFWRMVSVAAAAAVVIVLAVLTVQMRGTPSFDPFDPRDPRYEERSAGPAVRPTAEVRVAPTEPPRDRIPQVVARGQAKPASRTRSTTAQRTRPPQEPEVLVSAAEAAALRELLIGIRDGRVDLSLVPEPVSAARPLAFPTPVSFERIVFAPLTTAREREESRP